MSAYKAKSVKCLHLNLIGQLSQLNVCILKEIFECDCSLRILLLLKFYFIFIEFYHLQVLYVFNMNFCFKQ